ncbi:MAG TPA: ArsA family ATPase, partial [Nakamurella sp.]
MRIALHTGKGGVGKTTISAATAVACAAGGARTLLVSTDPAHSVADVLGTPVGGDPTSVAGVDRLWAAQVDTRGRFEQSWSHIRNYLVGVLSARGMAEVQAEELVVLPGAEEIVALLELRRLAASGDFDSIVVDCAPTGETLRLLALPETIGFYAQRLLGAPQRVLRSIAASFTGMPGAPNAIVRDAVGELLSDLMAARALLADPAITGVRLVLTPERMVVAEARRLFTALSLHGFAVEAVTVNRLLPSGVGGDFLRRQRESQREAMTQVEESFQGLPIRRILQKPEEPIGIAALSELAADVFGPLDPLAIARSGPAIEVSGSDGWYRLSLPLPLVERGDIALSRSGADLVVTVGDVRRRIALPSVL